MGFTNGVLKICDGVSLQDLHAHAYRFSRDAITHIAFSHNSKYLAVAVSTAIAVFLFFGRCRCKTAEILRLVG